MRTIIVLAALPLLALPLHARDIDATIAEIVVTSQRREQSMLEHAGNIARLDAETVNRVGHQHIHELLSRVAGVWVTRASGQEHLTAIRSPVLTGPGSCGAFLFLEDGVPIRPAGFCNVNSLFEAGTEYASGIEVIRGPGNALYGSNALHGTINVLLPSVGDHDPQLSVETGSNEFYRVRANLPFAHKSDWLTALVFADDGGFRDDSGYVQAKLHAKRRWDTRAGRFVLGVSATSLDQETAGFILGEDAYKDSSQNRENLNPEAFRKATSLRVQGRWTRALSGFDLDLRPYLRRSDMEFLQHFLPGQPLEENGHTSGGMLATATFDEATRTTIVGIDAEWANMFLTETQAEPAEGSPFLVETRPVGKHYDYDVTSFGIAAYVQSDWRLGERLTLGAGLRGELLRYDYDNRMLAGNTRDDGSECGFGGCLYTRPADRSDSFMNVAPKLSLGYGIGERSAVYAGLARGFRAPQATELYRLQSGQSIADLDSERIDSFEAGWRSFDASWSADVTLYYSAKRDSIFRDAEGFNVSGGRSLHRGMEATLVLQPADAWTISLDASYARHTYDFDAIAARGEEFVAGRDVDTAPRFLGSAELVFDPASGFDAALQWTAIGEYYLDAENRFRYPGHAIANLRAGFRLGSRFHLVLHINNLTDRDIADRADYAFGSFRYFPGRGREFFARIRYSPPQ